MRIIYKDVNVDISEVSDDYQQGFLEEEILIVIGELNIFRPYFSSARFNCR